MKTGSAQLGLSLPELPILSPLTDTMGDEVAPCASGYRTLIESLRVLLAIIAALMMFDKQVAAPLPLLMGVIAFAIYALVLLWWTANGAIVCRPGIFFWIDALWFLLLLSLETEARTHYFPFLFFPVFFAAWRGGYRESFAIATFSCLASLVVFVLRDPGISWTRLLAPHLSLFVVVPLFVALARVAAVTRESRAFAAGIVARLDPRQGFDTIVPDLITQIAGQFDAAVAILAIQTFEGRDRVFCWETAVGSSELSEAAALPIVEQALALADEVAFGFAGARHWWQQDRQIGIGSSGSPISPAKADRDTLLALADTVGKTRLVSVPLSSPGVGHIRLILAGDSINVAPPFLDALSHIVEQIAPSLENAFLRERLVTEAADTERARIGRDLHDSAIQPYIGLKFAIEALQRRAGANNPVAPDLARLVEMVTEELAATREVISGLRGTPGKGGALLANAVRRQASRFGQLFGIQVEVDVEGGMPVSRRIAGEIFHIVAEGLSNIRRHTQARRAWISLSAVEELLVLRIRNVNDLQMPAISDFTPVSLTERATGLGGSVDIDHDESSTTVTVSVPMPANKSKER